MFPEKGDEISVRLASDTLLDEAVLRFDDYEGLESDDVMSYLGFHDNAYWYEGRLSVFNSDEKLTYFFIVKKDGEVSYYSKKGLRPFPPVYSSRFTILPSLDAPSWISDASCYQIFPDRFFNGDKSNDVKDGEYGFDGATVQAKSFDEEPEEFEKSRCLDFYNGDLKGVEEKLDYLKKMGISLIYLNPIFQSRTVHRYDSVDFFNVDEKLGGNDALISLVRKAHENGIRIMLDISINHMGTDSKWYKRALDGDEECSSYFTHNEDGSIKYWNDVSTLADLDYHSEALRNLIYKGKDSAIRKFLRAPFDIDAWRLDVAPELARTKSSSLCLEVWREVRRCLKEEKRDLYLVGEGWDDSLKYLEGDAWDSTMNYFGSSRVFRTLIGEEDRFLTQGWGFPPKERKRISARDAVEAINSYLEQNPDQMNYFMMNLIDSHDTPRLHNNRAVFRKGIYIGCVIASFMLPGMPSIYYGDENLMDGEMGSVEASRYPMCWDESRWDMDTHEAYKRMGELRKLPFIPYSSLRIESIDNEAFMIARFSRNNAVIAIINRCPRKRNVSVDLFALPSDSAVLWYGNGSLSIKDRFLEAELPAEESIVVLLSGGSLPTA